MRRTLSLLIGLLSIALLSAQARTTLDIYLVDVEGGNATLFVAPSGDSLLIDTGNGGAGAMRDADRIMAAAKDARLTQIDHLITTHYHGDHYGAMSEVASRIPIKDFIDHGPNVQPAAAADEFLQKVYPQLYAKSKHTIAKPGDKIELKGLDARVVASAGQMIAQRAPGRRQRESVLRGLQAEGSRSERERAVGRHARHVRPVQDRAPRRPDVEQGVRPDVSRPTGWAPWICSSCRITGRRSPTREVLVHALAPRVMIMNNGTRKGGQPDAMKVMHSSPGLEDLWQIHFSLLSGQEYTVPGMFIANGVDEQPAAMPIAATAAPAPGPGAAPPPVHNGPAYWIKVSAREDGSFTVTNARNGFSKTYAARR